MKSLFLNWILVLYFFSFSSNGEVVDMCLCVANFLDIDFKILVGAINCFSCFKTRGWIMERNSRGWGLDLCNNFSTDTTVHDSAKKCSTSYCITYFSSYDQEDFHGVREERDCDQRRGRVSKHKCYSINNLLSNWAIKRLCGLMHCHG